MLNQPALVYGRLQQEEFHQQQELQRRALLAQLNAEKERRDSEFSAERLQILQANISNPEWSGMDTLDVASLRALAQKHGREPFLQTLRRKMSASEADVVLQQLLGDVPALAPQQPVVTGTRAAGDKTDPLRRSVELLEKGL